MTEGEETRRFIGWAVHHDGDWLADAMSPTWVTKHRRGIFQTREQANRVRRSSAFSQLATLVRIYRRKKAKP